MWNNWPSPVLFCMYTQFILKVCDAIRQTEWSLVNGIDWEGRVVESEGLLDCYSCRSTQCQVLVISDVLVYGKGQEGAKGTRLLKMGGGRASGFHCITGYTFPTAPFTLLSFSLLAYYNLLLTFVNVLTVHIICHCCYVQCKHCCWSGCLYFWLITCIFHW